MMMIDDDEALWQCPPPQCFSATCCSEGLLKQCFWCTWRSKWLSNCSEKLPSVTLHSALLTLQHLCPPGRPNFSQCHFTFKLSSVTLHLLLCTLLNLAFKNAFKATLHRSCGSAALHSALSTLVLLTYAWNAQVHTSIYIYIYNKDKQHLHWSRGVVSEHLARNC